MIFYPGAKVEETAYAPLLHLIAEQGMDVCLVRMPFHRPILNGNKADRVFQTHDYKRWYIGGHSLGGTMAAFYASGHSEQLNGVILLAAYTTKSLNGVPAISIYGTRDGVLNMEKMKESEQYLSEDSKQYVIEGGNHAQFGNYGKQYGDGTADISSEEQQRITAEFILQNGE